jgi:acyl carrier protein
MSTTFERICTLLVKDHALRREQLSMDAALESLGIDSLATVELLWSVEEVFGIKLPPDPVDLHTLGDVVAHVDKLVAIQGAPAAAVAPTAASLSPS